MATPGMLADSLVGGEPPSQLEGLMAQARNEGLRQGFDAAVRFIMDALRTRHGQALADELERAGVDRRAWLSHMYALLEDVNSRRAIAMDEDGFDVSTGAFSGAASLSFDGAPISLGIAGRGGGVYQGMVGATIDDSDDDLIEIPAEDAEDL